MFLNSLFCPIFLFCAEIKPKMLCRSKEIWLFFNKPVYVTLHVQLEDHSKVSSYSKMPTELLQCQSTKFSSEPKFNVIQNTNCGIVDM